MSVLRKVPYIENVLGQLSEENLNLLKTVMNSSGITKELSLVNAEKLITTNDQGIYGCVCEFDLGYEKTGILIFTNSLCVLLAYNRFEEVAVYTINVESKTYEKSNEKCSIEELRRIVDVALGGGSGGTITPETLSELITGGSWIVADLSQDGTKVVIDVDQDLLDEIGSKQEALTDSEDIVVDTEDISHLHLSATIRNKIDKSLVVPSQAPTGTILVGVGTNNAQTNINIDSSLALVNGTLSVPVKNVGGTNVDTFKVVKLSQSEYDGLSSKDAGTLYITVD